MSTTIPANVLLDPIVVLELVTLACTFYYIARMLLSENTPVLSSQSFKSSELVARISRHRFARSGHFEQQLLSLFGVGALISQPKNSLRQQRAFRRAYSYGRS